MQRFLLVLVSLTLVTTGPALPSSQPVTVSPGTGDHFTTASDRCPTFSWGEVTEAERYRLLVFDLGDLSSEASDVSALALTAGGGTVLEATLAGTATSWTPDLAHCLEPRRRYAWLVGAETDNATLWSEPSLFEIAQVAVSPELERAFEELFQRYVREGRLRELQAIAAGSLAATQPESAPPSTPKTSVDALTSTGDAALRADLAATSGETYGVLGTTHSTDPGTAGVVGEAAGTSGETAGVRGVANSADGAGGVFVNTAGGSLLKGLSGDDEKLAVDATGAVVANAFILDCQSAATFWRDADDDTFGDPGRTAQACSTPSGYVNNSDDCDDGEPTVPGPEVETTPECSDSIDNDCDTLIDDLDDDCCPATFQTWYLDGDNDQYGVDGDTIDSCTQPAGYVTDGGDCNDGNAGIHPNADETCNGVDDDCDAETDEEPVDGTTYYLDSDADDYGDPDTSTQACSLPGADWTTDNTDCDDGDADINPDATELCGDGIDNNCNGAIDEGFGDLGQACGTGACAGGTYICSDDGTALECDTMSNASPETCNGIDDDCDGATDEGNPGGGEACSTGLPGICSTGTSECTDGTLSCVADNVPVAETCNLLDDDCDGAADEGNPEGGAACVTGQLGICSAGTVTCLVGSLSCQPNSAPAPEVCNGLDDDCDGPIDEGNPGGGGACVTGQPGICSDGTEICVAGSITCQPDNSPTAEVCNGLDDDCDGQTDETVDCSHLSDACNVGYCDSNAGMCLASPEAEGTPCDDLAACTVDTTCSSGSCGNGDNACSSPPTECYEPEGFCTEEGGGTYSCDYFAVPNGTLCNGGLGICVDGQCQTD